MWCPACVQDQGHVQSTAASRRHPDLDESQRLYGVVHTTGGRRLSHHTGATQEEQEARLGDQKGWLHHVSFRPAHFAIEGARAYNSKIGLGDPHATSYEHVRQNADTIREVGRHYDALPEHDRASLSSFAAMGHEVGQQYHHLTHTMGVHVQSVDHDPYEDVHAMVHDVEHNKRLLVMGTHVTGGHPFFSDAENDRFRAVHDFFGHAATGRSFDRHGEQAAYLAHSQMFTPHARPAMASETKGQNASLILNGHFGPQKVALMDRKHWDDSSLHGVNPHAAAMMERMAAGWDAEDVIRHELGRQKVQPVSVDGEHIGHLCPEHLRFKRNLSDAATGLAAETGLGRHYPVIQTGAPTEGRCTDCARVSGTQSMEMPWETRRQPGAPVERSDVAPPQPTTTPRGRPGAPGAWPYREHFPHEQQMPFHPEIRSLNMRVAIALPGQTFRGIRIQAHDSGDGETIFHCPFCGSGQVIARSDGTVECEFCSTAFTVQVQPQMPAFPQTIDGVPVDVPGMPAGGANANVPPGAADGPPAGPGGDPGAVSGPPGDDGGDDSDDDGGDDDKPAFLKGSRLRTARGHVLTPDQYMRHLALTYGRDRELVLEQVRDENGRR